MPLLWGPRAHCEIMLVKTALKVTIIICRNWQEAISACFHVLFPGKFHKSSFQGVIHIWGEINLQKENILHYCGFCYFRFEAEGGTFWSCRLWENFYAYFIDSDSVRKSKLLIQALESLMIVGTIEGKSRNNCASHNFFAINKDHSEFLPAYVTASLQVPIGTLVALTAQPSYNLRTRDTPISLP